MTKKVALDLIGFAPDLNPTTNGIIRDCTRIIPSLDGFKPMRSPVSVGLPALAAECRGGAVVKKTDDSQRLIVGTQTKLYESAGTSWTDVSSGTYTGGPETRWRLAQFGDTTYAVNKADAMQYSTSGSFAARGGSAPKASIIISAYPGFLMAFDYNDGVNDYADGWYCSALNNPADWANSISTQSASGRLQDTPGPIKAGKSLGQNIIAYKERSMYLGVYVGPPFIWDWQLIPGEIGAPSQESVANIGTAHIFPGYEDFYYFDGSRPVPIGNPLKDWFNSNADKTYKYKMQTSHDKDNSNVYFWYPNSDKTITNAVVYNYRKDKWGCAELYTGDTLEHSLEYLSGGITYNGLGTLYNTWNDLPTDISYDSSFWTSSTPQQAIFLDDHVLYSLTGVPANLAAEESSFTGCFVGQNDQYSTINRIRPRYISNSTNSASVILKTTTAIGAAISTSVSYSVGEKSDFQKSAKFFSPEFTFRGDYEIVGYDMYFEDDGMD